MYVRLLDIILEAIRTVSLHHQHQFSSLNSSYWIISMDLTLSSQNPSCAISNSPLSLSSEFFISDIVLLQFCNLILSHWVNSCFNSFFLIPTVGYLRISFHQQHFFPWIWFKFSCLFACIVNIGCMLDTKYGVRILDYTIFLDEFCSA